ncbi:MAG: pyridine nucleotide-disulfide oxidoreductase, partial [Renibacterium salmoninarum]|nr:pyridine nucleotide-disulfide oxidoreductase [Renibacterium salmoninarum]
DGTGNARGTGEFVEYPVQAVYRSIGYFGSALPGLPYDPVRGVIPNGGGRVIDESGSPMPGVYATGWIKRGPVGLIGHTKGDALETIGFLLEDLPGLAPAPMPDPEAVVELLDARGIEFTSWEGWHALDAHEKSLGEGFDAAALGLELQRERVKVVARDEMIRISRLGQGTEEPSDS